MKRAVLTRLAGRMLFGRKGGPFLPVEDLSPVTL